MPQSDYKPPYKYSWSDFSEHMHHFLEVPEAQVQDLEKYFLEAYSNNAEAKWKMSRFVAARAFVEHNHGKFEEFYIKGAPKNELPGGMLQQQFIYALWAVYARCSDDYATPFCPIELMLGLARRHPDFPAP